MNVGVKIDISDATTKLRKLGGIIAVRRLYERIGLAAQADVQMNFRKQGNNEGQWKPLAPSTIKRRREAGKGAKILQDTGTLRQTITYKTGSFGVRIGTQLEYGKYHQDGRGPWIIPPRRAKGGGGIFSGPRTVSRTSTGEAFSKIGYHPGIPRRPFLPTAKYAEQNIAAPVIDKMLQEAASMTGGTYDGGR